MISSMLNRVSAQTARVWARRGFSAMGFAMLLFTAACTGGTPVDETGGCKVDSVCPGGVDGSGFCDEASGECRCRNDNACDGQNEFCNAAGLCQPRTGCTSNADCSPGSICDVTAGECTELQPGVFDCALDSHCPYGTYCQANVCQRGCLDNGDCPLGQPCMNGACNASPGACNAPYFCEFGQLCSDSTNTCVDHSEKNVLCAGCNPYRNQACPGATPLGDGPACLIDPVVTPISCNVDNECGQWPGATCEKQRCQSDADCPSGGSCDGFLLKTCSVGTCSRFFCGSSDCSDDDPCPRGYSCYTLSLVTGQACTSDAQCPGERGCSNGGENGNRGYCSCLSDADCPQGQGLTCENPGPTGSCIQGRTCGPSSGLTCDDL